MLDEPSLSYSSKISRDIPISGLVFLNTKSDSEFPIGVFNVATQDLSSS